MLPLKSKALFVLLGSLLLINSVPSKLVGGCGGGCGSGWKSSSRSFYRDGKQIKRVRNTPGLGPLFALAVTAIGIAVLVTIQNSEESHH